MTSRTSSLWNVVGGGVEKHLVEQGAGSRGYVGEQTAIEAVVDTEGSIRSVIVTAAVVIVVVAAVDGGVSSVSRWHHWLLWYLGLC